MTPHFSDAELVCKCGCGMLPQLSFMQRVEQLRLLFNRPMIVASGARCAAHNATVSKTGATGPHTTGRAIDILVRGPEALELLILAQALDFTGFGVSQKGVMRFIHIDDLPNSPTSPRPTIWSY